MCGNTTAPVTPAGGFVPSVARFVHYWHRGSADGVYPPVCSAAVITGVVDAGTGVIAATVFSREGFYLHPALERDESPAGERKGGTWHVPEYVPPADTPPGIPAAS